MSFCSKEMDKSKPAIRAIFVASCLLAVVVAMSLILHSGKATTSPSEGSAAVADRSRTEAPSVVEADSADTGKTGVVAVVPAVSEGLVPASATARTAASAPTVASSNADASADADVDVDATASKPEEDLEVVREKATEIARSVLDGLANPASEKASADAPPTVSIPEGTQLVSLVVSEPHRVNVTFRFPGESLKPGDISPRVLYEIGYSIHMALEPLAIESLNAYAQDPATGTVYGFDELQPVEQAKPALQDEGYDGPTGAELAALDAVKNPPTAGRRAATVPRAMGGQPAGALAGKTVYLNQGHGWFDDIDFGRWRVQRGIVLSSGLLEDFTNGETMNLFLIPYLMNAGATVLTVRERDHQTNMVIIDNEDGTSNPSNGTYVETGTWANSTLRGFKQKTTSSWVGVTVNPFDNGGINRLADRSGSSVTATAKWTPNIPQAGYYWVYASWSRYSGRNPQARYIVHHSGGDTEFVVDQTKYGFMWYPLGQFYFEAGTDSSKGSVELTNYSPVAGNVSADAVRFGGGMGDMERHTHGVSNRPRWEEEAVDHLQWNGFGSSGLAYTGDDDEAGGWSDRPQFAGWMDSFDGDSVYMGHHTNAGGGTGTRTFVHSTASQASINLREAMHNALIADIQAAWDPAWYSKKLEGNYGENNQSSLGNVPGYLMETLFHDRAEDIAKYQEPKFRKLLGRSFMHGFIRYFEARDSVNLTDPPEEPTHFYVKNLGGGQAQLGWNAPPYKTGTGYLGDAATGYIVEQSGNGYGFVDVTEVTGTTATISNLTAGELYFFRIRAKNDGGVSFPTETLAVRLPAAGYSTLALLVNGFDREDASLAPTEAVTNAGTVRRLDYLGYNTFDYSIQHAKAMDEAGLAFDGASNEALVADAVSADDYVSLFWICGEESTTDETFSSAEQTIVSSFLGVSGNSLFVSGAEILWDLDSQGTTADQTFVNGTLRADYAGDDGGSYQVQGSAAPFVGLSSFAFDRASGAPYDAQYPDRLAASNGSTVAMSYVGGTADGAATVYSGNVKVIVLGFPFETIASASVRNDIMDRVVSFFGLDATPTPSPSPSPSPSPTPSPSPSPSPSPTPSPSPSPTPSPTPSLTPSPSPSPTPTPSPSPTPFVEALVENFEGYATGSDAMFRDPAYSGTTTGINTATDISEVSAVAANDILDPGRGSLGTQSHRFFWTWTTPGSGFVRATTSNLPTRPNPIICFAQGLSVYVKVAQGEVDFGLYLRETGVEGSVGGNGGTTGVIEKLTSVRRLSASTEWQYVYFDLPNETYGAVNGNGVLDGTWGVLEAFTFAAVSSSSAADIEIYVDDIYNGFAHSPNYPPSAPTGLAATPGDGQVSLDWANNSESDLDGYNVYRATATGGPYTKLNASLLSASAFVDSTASNFTTYYYVATAVDETAKESAASAEASATPEDTTAPSAPTGLAATAGDSYVDLEWNDNTEPDLDGYNVYRATATGGPYTQLNSSPVGASGYVDLTAQNATTYYYVVTAVDDTPNANESGFSGEVSATPADTTAPAAPTGLAATAGDGEVALDWNNNGESDLAGYNVYRGTATGGPYTQLNGSLVAASAYNDATAVNGTTYYYVVSAVDTVDNESGTSAEVSAAPHTSTPDMDDVILDNDSGSPVYAETGTWYTSGSTGYNGGTYRYANAGGAHTATWTAELGSGLYDVQVIYRSGTNRATSASYSISAAGGNQTATVDQTLNNLTWVSLGQFRFIGGSNTIALNAAASTGGSIVVADAVRFLYVGPTLIDNDNGAPEYTETGSWVTSSSSGYNGLGYRWCNAGYANTASWDLNLPASGNWTVYVIYRASTNRTTSTKYTVETAAGTQTVYINQTLNNMTWVSLGTWYFDAGTGSVTVDASGSSGGSVVIADTVKAEQ